MTDTNPHSMAMTQGRRADSARRRQRTLKALNAAINQGDQISVSGIARRAGVDRSFLSRHRDLLERIHAAEAQPPNAPGVGPTVSRASLQADLTNAHQRAVRLAARVHQLEKRLSEALGEHTWHESGLGVPDDIDRLKQQIGTLEQHTVDLHLQLQERNDDLAAARAANRELMAQLNTTRTTP
jgi:hypothetical protein